MSAKNAIKVVVITPEREALNQHTDSVVIPAHDGELGVLTGRAPLMCELGIGQLRYQDAGTTKRIFIDGGFAQVHDNQVTVLTNRAIPAAEVTRAMVAEEEATAGNIHSTDPEAQEERTRARRRASALRDLVA
ncbi:MAG: ATP synthase F1 subunit epsilon [Phycisphaerae bacterium]